jgi:type VI protein secretion system component Hcp
MKIFLKLDKLMGSSTDPGHVHWIELSSCSFLPGRRPPAEPSPPWKLKPRPQVELQCSKTFDSSSSALLKMMTDGSVITSGTVDFVDDHGVIRLRMSLSDVMLPSFSTRRGPSDSVMEIFGLLCVIESGEPADPLTPGVNGLRQHVNNLWDLDDLGGSR